jgi:hypothetical protein
LRRTEGKVGACSATWLWAHAGREGDPVGSVKSEHFRLDRRLLQTTWHGRQDATVWQRDRAISQERRNGDPW